MQQDGRLLGTFGDVGVISFAQSKTIVTGIRGSGGVLLINRPALAAQLREACEILPTSSGRLGQWADFLWNHVGHVYTGHSGYYLSRVLVALGHAPAAAAPAMQISNLEAGIALAQLGRRTTVRPGWLSKLLGWSLALLPRWGQVRVIAQVMKGMTKHHQAVAERP